MNDVSLAHVPLAAAIRQQIAIAREMKLHVLEAHQVGMSKGTKHDDALHDFRVSLRRIRTFLRAARILWSSKKIERIEQELRFYARQTGTLRDDEVLRETLDELKLTQAARDEIGAWLVRRRRSARTKTNAVVRILREAPTPHEAERAKLKRVRPFDRVLERLDAVVSTEPETQMFSADLAQVATHQALRDVMQAAQADVQDVEAMHALRIREKRLRYTTELFADFLGDDASRLQKHATRMQRRLGELHDVDDALIAITRARGLQAATQQATAAALRALRSACAANIEPHLVDTRTVAERLVTTCAEPLTMPST